MTELEERQQIDKYLHGELENAELENLEEQLFLDDNFFERIETEEMTLVDRYVRKAMDADETKRFENGYLTTPERREKVAEAALFHEELGKMKPERKSWLGALSPLFGAFKMPVVQFGTAAVVLLFAVVMVGIFTQIPQIEVVRDNSNVIEPPHVNIPPRNDLSNSELPDNSIINYSGNGTNNQSNVLPDKTQTPANSLPTPKNTPDRTQYETLTPYLSGGTVVTNPNDIKATPIKIKKQTASVNLNLPIPEEIESDSFSVFVIDSAGKTISRINSAKADKGRKLSLSLKTGNLADGKYTVSVNPSNNLEDTVIYRFDVQKEK